MPTIMNSKNESTSIKAASDKVMEDLHPHKHAIINSNVGYGESPTLGRVICHTKQHIVIIPSMATGALAILVFVVVKTNLIVRVVLLVFHVELLVGIVELGVDVPDSKRMIGADWCV